MKAQYNNGTIEAYCGFLVPTELLSSLARINPEKAAVAVAAFFSLPINMIQNDEPIAEDAASIMLESGAGYASIHAAYMRQKGLNQIITEDAKDWKRIKNINIIKPLEYEKLVKT